MSSAIAEPGAQSTAPRRSRAQSNHRNRYLVHALQLLVLIALLAAWQVGASSGLIDPVLAKTPLQSWRYFREAAANGEIWHNSVATLSAVLIAWVLASIVGVICGIALGLLPRTEQVLTPFLDAFNAMPRIALAPLFIVALGIGTTAKVALASTLVFFIVLSSARAGVRSTDAEWLRLSATLGASKVQVFTKIMLPVATPAIFSSLRLGLIYSLLGVVGSELISAKDGLGQLISEYSAVFRLEAVYAILIYLAIIAVILNQLMSLVERRMLRWQPPADE